MRMTTLRSLAALAALAAVANAGCASTSSAIPSSVASNPLVSSLTSGLAQNKLSPDQFSAVSNAIRGLGDITKAAGPLLGSMPLSSLGDVQNAFSKLGMSPDMVGKFAPIITDAVSKGGGSAVSRLLGGLFK